MTNNQRRRLNNALASVRTAGVDDDGMLWVRTTGRDESPERLAGDMERAEAILRALGWQRNRDAVIFRDGLDWGQALEPRSATEMTQERILRYAGRP